MRSVIFLTSTIFSVTACGVEHVESELTHGSFASGVLIDSGIGGGNLPPNTVVPTYDDGPDAQTLQIGEYLWQQGIQATFFVNGRRICRMVNGACATPPPTTGCPTAPGQSNTRMQVLRRRSS